MVAEGFRNLGLQPGILRSNFGPTQMPMDRNTAMETLQDEIRRSGPAFIRAATEAFHKRISLEYHRLRGYAVEDQGPEMELTMVVWMNFSPNARSVTIETTPRVNPRAGVTTVKVK